MSTSMSPDLASVLRTLASFTSAQPSTSHPPPTPSPAARTLEEGEEVEDEEEYDPSNFVPTTTIPRAPVAPTPQPPPPSISTPQLPPPPQHYNPAVAPPPPLSSLSSSTITTWPPALRYVMTTLIPNQAATHRIQHMIKTQHEHERQWWAGREALLLKQQGREEGRRRLNDVLASVGGLVNPLNEDSSPATDLQEISQYDRKVHRACMAMVAASTAELARLGVPFFNISPELLLPNLSSAPRGASGAGLRKSHNEDDDDDVDNDERRGEKVKDTQLDESQLRELQAKMLVLLEDLCSE